MKLDAIESVKEWLVRAGIVSEAHDAEVQSLSGGVSSRVWKITVKNNRWILKQALDKLNVADDWFSDVERIHREHEVMEALTDLLPVGSIPKLLHVDYIDHVYMMTCAEEGAQTWKDILMKGSFNNSIAENAASLLRTIHLNSNNIHSENKAKFHDQQYFIQLRIDPFHRHLMQKFPRLSSAIHKLIDELTLEKTSLVHGDFSPKNMLVEKNNNIVLIDFEVAHWGNPVFDLAFCISHLMLKGWHLNKKQDSLQLIDVFLATYDHAVKNLTQHIGLMLLARMDGKSPINYIQDENLKNVIREVAFDWIQHDDTNSGPLFNIDKAFRA